MKFIYSTIEGRLYEEYYTTGRSEAKTPPAPKAVTAYVPATLPNEWRGNESRSFLYPFEAKTYEEAFTIAESLKAYSFLADLYHEQELQKWRTGRPTDNEKILISEYQKKKEGAGSGQD